MNGTPVPESEHRSEVLALARQDSPVRVNGLASCYKPDVRVLHGSQRRAEVGGEGRRWYGLDKERRISAAIKPDAQKDAGRADSVGGDVRPVIRRLDFRKNREADGTRAHVLCTAATIFAR